MRTKVEGEEDEGKGLASGARAGRSMLAEEREGERESLHGRLSVYTLRLVTIGEGTKGGDGERDIFGGVGIERA